MVGFDKRIYLVDFRLAQCFRDHTTHMHTPLINGLSLVGSIRYTSINSHMGFQQARQDDLESLAYTLLFLLQGKVPWQGIAIRNPQCHRAAVLRKKQEICGLSRDVLPSAVGIFIHYAQSLAFEEDPDYDYIRTTLADL